MKWRRGPLKSTHRDLQLEFSESKEPEKITNGILVLICLLPFDVLNFLKWGIFIMGYCVGFWSQKGSRSSNFGIYCSFESSLIILFVCVSPSEKTNTPMKSQCFIHISPLHFKVIHCEQNPGCDRSCDCIYCFFSIFLAVLWGFSFLF